VPEDERGPSCTHNTSPEEDDSLEGFQETRRKFLRDSLITGGAAASIGALGITMTPGAHAADTLPGSPPSMYIPTAFREDRLEVLHALIASHSLATLVTCGSNGLLANLIPFTLTGNEKLGVLRAHIAKANSQVAALREGGEALVIFQGPEAYITPSWYPSKKEHGRVTPTWNYAVVQARGKARVIDDPDWILSQVGQLTDKQEMHRPHPWKVSDAPKEFIAGQLKAIAGVEISIDRLEGKWKVSQNRSEADRRGVAEGLSQKDGNTGMAELVARSPNK
jgi:transcriptional regulator